MAKDTIKTNKEALSVRQQRAPKEETLRHKEIFEIYYAMGDARSLRTLSDIVGINEVTAQIWSSTFGWQDRVADRDKELIRRIQEDFADESLKFRCFYIDLIKQMIQDCLMVDETGKRSISIKPNSVSDLEKLIKLHMQLMGDATPADGIPTGGGSGGLGNVTIVMPQQLNENDWSKMVNSTGGPLAFPPVKE